MSTTLTAAESTPAVTPAAARGWIIAPAWDLLFFVLTPVLIVPAVLGLQRIFSPQQIWLVVISFLSMGHHLPGFLRAYGDSELRARFFWRLLLAPPLVFTAAWWFEHQHLHGLRVLVLLWAIWHGLMQTYGFLRIYDVKRGIKDAWGARLDLAACVAVFALGTVFSQARMYGLVDAFWQAGGPLFDARLIVGLQWTVGLAAVVVLNAYVVHVAQRLIRKEAVSLNKQLLVLSTAGIWWFTGAINDTLIGVAMFEIYHAVQYLAIVWVFHRRSIDRVAAGQGTLAAFFRRRGLLVGAYLCLIAAFGCVRFFSTSITGQSLAQVFAALLVTSTLMHYYFDGFIWKVREKSNQEQLAGTASGTGARSPSAAGWLPALAHAGKWALFILPAAALYGAERRGVDASSRTAVQLQSAKALAQVAPSLPTAQLQLANAASDAGDLVLAIEAAERATVLDPQSADAQGTLGNARLRSGNFVEAVQAYSKAIALAPSHAGHRLNLAGALGDAGHWAEAEVEYQAALEISPNDGNLRNDVARFHLRWASTQMMETLASKTAPLEHLRIAALLAVDEKTVRDALRLSVHLLIAPPLEGPSAQLAAAIDRRDWPAAVAVIDVTMGRKIDPAVTCWTLGVALSDRVATSESALQAALAHNPNLGEAHLELGRLLWSQANVQRQLGLVEFGKEPAEVRARTHLERAVELGQKLPDECAGALDSQ